MKITLNQRRETLVRAFADSPNKLPRRQDQLFAKVLNFGPIFSGSPLQGPKRTTQPKKPHVNAISLKKLRKTNLLNQRHERLVRAVADSPNKLPRRQDQLFAKVLNFGPIFSESPLNGPQRTTQPKKNACQCHSSQKNDHLLNQRHGTLVRPFTDSPV